MVGNGVSSNAAPAQRAARCPSPLSTPLGTFAFTVTWLAIGHRSSHISSFPPMPPVHRTTALSARTRMSLPSSVRAAAPVTRPSSLISWSIFVLYRKRVPSFSDSRTMHSMTSLRPPNFPCRATGPSWKEWAASSSRYVSP